MSNIRELLEDIAHGDGPDYVIGNQWLDPAAIEDPDLSALAEIAVAAHALMRASADHLQRATDAYLSTHPSED